MKFIQSFITTVAAGSDYEAVAREHFVGLYGSDTLPDYVTIVDLKYKARDAGNDMVTVIADAQMEDTTLDHR